MFFRLIFRNTHLGLLCIEVHLIINFYLLSFNYTGERFCHNINRICGLVDDTTYKKIIAALSEEISVTHVRLHTN